MTKEDFVFGFYTWYFRKISTEKLRFYQKAQPMLAAHLTPDFLARVSGPREGDGMGDALFHDMSYAEGYADRLTVADDGPDAVRLEVRNVLVLRVTVARTGSLFKIAAAERIR